MTHLFYLWFCYGTAIFLLSISYITASLEWHKTRRSLRHELKIR